MQKPNTLNQKSENQNLKPATIKFTINNMFVHDWTCIFHNFGERKLKWILHGFLRLLIEYYDIHQNNTTRFLTSLLQDYSEEYYLSQTNTTI